ncbi:MAG: BREX-1 system adenine-specific DNA-methyltransferase PglX, partial [Candidatus Omnitrophica bacterium]|nr:BREX-1 system adenine-specific DNA-methyltransferase PglX [Candidatus Omnitrophota bacterium]
NIKDAEKIANFDIFDQTAQADWFAPEWMLGVEDGFDIVIGNPPYISTKEISIEQKKQLEQQYGFSDDAYNHFYFKGIQLLKENGILAYISSKTFWTIQTKKNLRELLLKNKILKLFDTANPFESSMVDTCIAIVKKAIANKNHQIIFLDGRKNLSEPQKYTVPQYVYATTPNQVFFVPTPMNIKIYERLGKKVNELLNQWWDLISTSKNIEKNKKKLEAYRKNLQPGDITLLGLITEGGQGLATGNNGKYIGVLEGTKWADNVRKQRPEKLLLATEFCKQQKIKTKQDAQRFLEQLSEKELRELFDDLKEKYGRDIFGQGWLYRIVSKDEIADVNNLTEDEKLNGIKGSKTFVPYDKGDKEGNRWYAPTPYYIDWSRENVRKLQKDPKARWQGYQYFFREGFCWTNVLNPNARLIKSRLKERSVNDVGSMSLYSIINITPDYYFVSILNSSLIFNFYRTFINYSVNIQINDIRQLPIIIPTSDQLKIFENIFNRAYNIQKQKFEGKINEEEAETRLNEIQKELDEIVENLYMEEINK